MDYKLMSEHVSNVVLWEPDVVKEDGSNLCDFYCADVVGNRRFAQNYGGYPRSDIAEINAQASLQQAANLLNDLSVFEGSYLPADLSPEEIMLSHKSKYCQAPSEMIDFIERQFEIRDLKYGRGSVASQIDSSKDETIKFDESINND